MRIGSHGYILPLYYLVFRTVLFLFRFYIAFGVEKNMLTANTLILLIFQFIHACLSYCHASKLIFWANEWISSIYICSTVHILADLLLGQVCFFYDFLSDLLWHLQNIFLTLAGNLDFRLGILF